MKKIYLLSLFFLLLPLIILAIGGSYTVKDYHTPGMPVIYSVYHSGMVPCGRCLEVNPPANAWFDGECSQKDAFGEPVLMGDSISVKFIPCTMCHFFAMLNGAINFILLKLIPPIAALIFVIGGIIFYQGGQNQQKAALAKKVLTSAVIGFALIYGSYLIINTLLTQLDVAEWTGLGNWFQITCDTIIR